MLAVLVADHSRTSRRVRSAVSDVHAWRAGPLVGRRSSGMVKRVGLAAVLAAVVSVSLVPVVFALTGALAHGAGQSGVAGVAFRVRWASAASFNPADGDTVNWTFGSGTVTAQRTGLVCDGAFIDDGVQNPTHGVTSYPGRVPAALSSHSAVPPNGASVCWVYLFHDTGYDSITHAAPFGTWETVAAPTPTPTPSAALGDVTIVAFSGEALEWVQLVIFTTALAGGFSALGLAWLGIQGMRR